MCYTCKVKPVSEAVRNEKIPLEVGEPQDPFGS